MAPLGFPAGPGDVGEISSPELAARLAETVVVDVREPNETAGGTIAGALKIPLGQLPLRVSELPAGRPIVAVCARGMRSKNAVRLLKAAGFADSVSLVGGMFAWIGEGRPIER